MFVLLILASLLSSCKKDNTDLTKDNNEEQAQINAADLMLGIVPNKPTEKAADSLFIDNTANFFVELFKNTTQDKKNSLISPISVLLALSMTANGAENNTLSQMEQVLGAGMPIAELNQYLHTYVNSLPSEEKSKLHIANSIWFKEGFQVKKDFLQTNADHYGANAYQSAFDETAREDINLWVKINTDGMIKEILSEPIDPRVMMYLINAVAFDAEWEEIYKQDQVSPGEFTNIHNQKQTVEFMSSTESIYLEDDKAIGFVKPYLNNKYSFVALLPNEDIAMKDYIESLSGTGLISTLKKTQGASVQARLPKFSYDYSINMNEALKALGMPEAFEQHKANLRKIADLLPLQNLYISKVFHKTFIEVNERGTKAGAATSVTVQMNSAIMEQKKVILDRPFVYAIVDNATNLPIFMGVLTNIETHAKPL